ncbi:flippase [Halococcus thailandensis]|uniref:Transport protein 56 (Polysaccharide biosynthesis transport protein) n=1 Tax=Halococcus thailandensis JCM 13552 TaxID=1227457 RepID=M0N9S7_9EURY|nr:flippase [Halococcus thailandensis]EMA54328.1 transport protein 56 (polysaccharide biosynthesis transport protein) [Halococcus thailandensis JCM 13552]
MSEESATSTHFESLRSILGGASAFISGQMFVKLTGFAINALLLRGLGPELYGVYSYAKSFIDVFSSITTFGSDIAVLRFLPAFESNPNRQNRVLGVASLASLFGGFLIAGGLFALAPLINKYTLHQPVFVDALQIFALLLPLDTLSKLIGSTFRGIELATYQVFVTKVLRPILRLTAVTIALLIGFSLLGTISVLVVASVAIFVIAGFVLIYRTSFRPAPPDSAAEAREFFEYSMPLMFSRAGTILYNRVDVFMVGFLLSSTAVGFYNIGFLVSSVVILPLTGLSQIFTPIASRLFEANNYEELDSIYSTITRWAFTVSLFAALFAIVYAREILALFGPSVVRGAPVLQLFAIGQLLNAAVGPSNDLLMMTDHERLSFVNNWVFGVVNVILDYVFIQKFGFVGAAFATASVLGLLNIARWFELQYLEGLSPYSRNYYKPLIAGTGSLASMYGATYLTGGISLLVVGGFVGVVVFGAILYALGIEQDDIEFISRIL